MTSTELQRENRIKDLRDEFAVTQKKFLEAKAEWIKASGGVESNKNSTSQILNMSVAAGKLSKVTNDISYVCKLIANAAKKQMDAGIAKPSHPGPTYAELFDEMMIESKKMMASADTMAMHVNGLVKAASAPVPVASDLPLNHT